MRSIIIIAATLLAMACVGPLAAPEGPVTVTVQIEVTGESPDWLTANGYIAKLWERPDEKNRSGLRTAAVPSNGTVVFRNVLIGRRLGMSIVARNNDRVDAFCAPGGKPWPVTHDKTATVTVDPQRPCSNP